MPAGSSLWTGGRSAQGRVAGRMTATLTSPPMCEGPLTRQAVRHSTLPSPCRAGKVRKGAKPEASDLQRERPLSARLRSFAEG